MVILAPQMLINIRHEIYNPSTPSHPSAMDTLTWDVNSKRDFNDYSVADTILRETAWRHFNFGSRRNTVKKRTFVATPIW